MWQAQRMIARKAVRLGWLNPVEPQGSAPQPVMSRAAQAVSRERSGSMRSVN